MDSETIKSERPMSQALKSIKKLQAEPKIISSDIHQKLKAF